MFVLGEIGEVTFVDSNGKIVEKASVKISDIDWSSSKGINEVNLNIDKSDLENLNALSYKLRYTKHSKKRNKLIKEIKKIENYFKL